MEVHHYLFPSLKGPHLFRSKKGPSNLGSSGIFEKKKTNKNERTFLEYLLKTWRRWTSTRTSVGLEHWWDWTWSWPGAWTWSWSWTWSRFWAWPVTRKSNAIYTKGGPRITEMLWNDYWAPTQTVWLFVYFNSNGLYGNVQKLHLVYLI